MSFKNAWKMWEQREFSAAQDGFVAASELETDLNLRKRAWCGAAFMMVRQEQDERLEDWLAVGREIGAGSVPAYEAALALYKKDDERLEKALLGAPVYEPQSMNPWVRGLSSLPISNWTERDFTAELLPPAQGDVGEARLVLLVSCDTNYYFRFAHILTHKVGQWHIRFHVIIADESGNPQDIERQVREHAENLHGNHSVSIEVYPGASKAYMASRRYLLAPGALEHYEVPVLVCDVDLAIQGDLAQLPCDIPMLRYTDQLTIPWQKMTANACLLTPNESGKRLAILMAKYLAQQFSKPKGDIWWVDQNALLFATRAASIEFRRWGPRFPEYFRAPTLHGDRDKDLLVSK